MRGGELLGTPWLKGEFARARGSVGVFNGKPLWQWRATEPERQRMRHLLHRYMPPHDPPDPHQAGLFCLFAAETLRRTWTGGPRSWVLVTDALGVALSQETCRALTAIGLEYWQRSLRKGDSSTRYLQSLVLEGGIPDALLTGEVEAFGRFLRGALADIEDYHADDRTSALRQTAMHRGKLPGTWQDDEILELATDLLLGIAQVRHRTRHLQPETLLAWLEANPDWEAGLPLDIASDRVRKLLVSLIAQPRKQTARTLSRLCYRVLARRGNEWTCAVVLETGGKFPASALAHSMFSDDSVTRVRMFLDTGSDAGVAIGILERDTDGMVRFAPLQKRPLPVPWDESVRVRLQCDGLERGTLILPGGDPLPDAPWVMEADAPDMDGLDETSRLRIVGTGSRRSRLPELYLAVDPGSGQLTDSKPSWIGAVIGTRRLVACLRRPCLWHETAGGLSLQFSPGDTADEEHPLALHPLRPTWTVLAPFVSLGAPGVGAGNGALSWRRTRQESWRRLDQWPLGRLQLAVRRDGVVWDTGDIVVLPGNARIAARRAGERRTVIDVLHLGPDVAIEGPAEVERNVVDGGVRITVEWPHLSEATIIVRTRSEMDTQPLRHRVRVPTGSGAILHDGVLLDRGTQIRFADLGDCRAVSGGDDGVRAELIVRVQGGVGRPTVIDRIGFYDDLPLHRVRRRLLRQFATVGVQDANTRMYVERNGTGGRHIEVRPYSAVLKSDATRGVCTVRNSDGLLVPKDVELLAVSVTRPGTEPLTLPRYADATWTLPGPDTPDTWLVVGSGPARGWFRPMLWVSGPAAPGETELSRLALIDHPEARLSAFTQEMQSIADRNGVAASADLRYLLDAIRLSRRHLIPALSLDALRAVARHPVIPVRLLWEADDATLQDVVELEDELPFLWCLSDINALRRIVGNFLTTLRVLGLSDSDAREAVNAKLAQLADRCPQVAAACWVAREANGILHPGNDEVPLSQLRHPELVGMLRARVGVRRVTDDEWQRLVAATHDWQNLPEDVRVDAPAYAASLIVARTTPVEKDIAVLRYCREQDADEFDFRFRTAFQLAVATAGTLP